jgi:rhomboid protease GluP
MDEGSDPTVAESPALPLVLPGRKRRTGRRTGIALLRASAFLGGGFLVVAWSERPWLGQLGVFAMLVGLYLVVPLLLRILRRSGGPFVVDATGITFPGGLLGRSRIRVPFESIDSVLDNVSSPEDGRDARAVFGTLWRTIVLDGDEFEDRDGLPRFLRAFHMAVLARPGGLDRRRAWDRRRRCAWKILSRRNPVTIWLLPVLLAVFLLQHRLGALYTEGSLVALLAMGANSHTLVAAGEWFRLFTANFLHGFEIHLGVNAVALWLVGRLVERCLGPSRFWLVVAVGAFAGAATSALVPRGPGVGFSTAVAGLFGSLATIHIRYGAGLPVGIRQSLRLWIVLLVINGGLSFIPQVDGAAHLGGFLGGAIVTWPLLGPTPNAPGPAVARPLALLALLVFLAAGVWCVIAAPSGEVERRRLGLVALSGVRGELGELGEELNNLAWEVAIDPDALPEDIELATGIMARVIDEDPTRPHRIDTLATLHHRAGRRDEAIRMERRVLRMDPNEVYATQLARFLEAGPLPVIDGEDPRLELTIRRWPPRRRGGEDGRIAEDQPSPLEGEEEPPNGEPPPTDEGSLLLPETILVLEVSAYRPTRTGHVVLLILREGGRRVGFGKLILPPGLSWRVPVVAGLAEDVTVEIALVGTHDAGPRRTPLAGIWEEHPAVARYP